MAVNVLRPIFEHGMYEHSYGSIPNRGAHKGKKLIKKWIEHDKKNVKYCLKMDIRKFFDSIPHDILKQKLSLIIHDKKFLNLLYELVDVVDKGLPLGFYTSQWLANWYLQDLDHYIKEELHAVHYIRYMDDMVIFGSNKRELHKVREAIITIYDIRQMMSYLGWIDCTDTYNMYEKYIKQYVDFRYCKKRISNYDRRIAKEKNRQERKAA